MYYPLMVKCLPSAAAMAGLQSVTVSSSAGGEATRVTQTGKGASYMHGWSPDGKYLVFCGERNKEYDVYRIPAAGGPKKG
jgi:Tol biopolymer transport system component